MIFWCRKYDYRAHRDRTEMRTAPSYAKRLTQGLGVPGVV